MKEIKQINDLDEIVRILFDKTQINLMCSYSGMGLTDFGLQLANHICKNKIAKVFYYYSPATSQHTHPIRILTSILSKIPLLHLDYFIVSKDEFIKAKRVFGRIKKLNIEFIPMINLNVKKLKEEIKKTNEKLILFFDDLEEHKIARNNLKPFTFDGQKIILDKYEVYGVWEPEKYMNRIMIEWFNYIRKTLRVPVLCLFEKIAKPKNTFSCKQIKLKIGDLGKINFGSLIKKSQFNTIKDDFTYLSFTNVDGKERIYKINLPDVNTLNRFYGKK